MYYYEFVDDDYKYPETIFKTIIGYNFSINITFGVRGSPPLIYANFELIEKITLILCSIFFVLGTIGNGLVIWIARFRMKKTINATWFLNLAITDFLCCASLLLRIENLVNSFQLPEKICCILNVILFLLNMSASVLLLSAMSIDRCVSVMWPFWAKVHRTQKLVRITAAIIWVLSVLWTVFVIWYYIFNELDFSEWCVTIYRYQYSYRYDWTIQVIRLFIMFVIPFLIILISYLIVFFKLKKSKRAQRSQRPYRIITAIILCFFICWCPYYIWPMTPMFSYNNDEVYLCDVIVINLVFFNSCINPIIYVFINQDIKHGFFRSILSRLEEVFKDQPNDLCREGEDVQQA